MPVIFLALGELSYAQEFTELPVCGEFTNPALVGQIQSGLIEKLNLIDAWRYEQHSCRYAPKRAFDNEPKSAWCEGAKDNGIDHVLLVPLRKRGARRVEVWAGYGKSKAVFKANNRLKKV